MDIVEIVSSIGFPILAFLLMYKFLVDEREENRLTIETLRKTIENNTTAITTLLEHFHKEG